MDKDSGYMFRIVLSIPKLIYGDCVYMLQLESAIP